MIDLLPDDRKYLDNRIKRMLSTTYPKNADIAYRIGYLQPNENSEQYYVEHGVPYYKFTDRAGQVFVGDEIWGIIKDNNFVTFLVRRSAETRNKARAKQNFKVDFVLYGTNDLDRMKAKMNTVST